MCNCGKKRASLNQQDPSSSINISTITTPSESINSKFEYTGSSPLTIIGSNTGSKYHFRYQGDIQEVMHDDAMFMTGVPALKRVQ